MKNQFERAGRASIPRFWSVFVICIYGQGDNRVYRANGLFPSQSTAMFTGHTVIQYANTITRARTYTVREPV